jgi:hypothetical protein
MALRGWSESDVKRDAEGRFSRFEAGSIPSVTFLPDALIDHIMPNVFSNDLSSDEFGAIEQYKMNRYGPINRGLRAGSLPAPDDETARRVDDVLARHSTPEDVWVSRACSRSTFGGKGPDEIVGRSYQDDGFMSTTVSEHLPGDFDNPENGYPIVLRLKVPKGTPAYYTEGMGDMPQSEHELLLGRGRRFDVAGVRELADGRYEVFAEMKQQEGRYNPYEQVPRDLPPHLQAILDEALAADKR